MNNNEIKERVESYREELLNRLGKLVSINSEEGKAKEGMPFGEGPAKALNTALDMLKEDGFEVKNLDNYAGYAQMGTGKKLIGVIGHLDVVPADKNDGWNTEPYEMVEKDGNVSLLGKWLPSINASNRQAVQYAVRLARSFRMKYADYRRALSALRARIKIIENNLREKDYSFDLYFHKILDNHNSYWTSNFIPFFKKFWRFFERNCH